MTPAPERRQGLNAPGYYRQRIRQDALPVLLYGDTSGPGREPAAAEHTNTNKPGMRATIKRDCSTLQSYGLTFSNEKHLLLNLYYCAQL